MKCVGSMSIIQLNQLWIRIIVGWFTNTSEFITNEKKIRFCFLFEFVVFEKSMDQLKWIYLITFVMVIWTRFCFSGLKSFLISYGARKVQVVFDFIQLIFIIIKKCVCMNCCILVLSCIHLIECMYDGHSFQIIENDMKTECWILNHIEKAAKKQISHCIFFRGLRWSKIIIHYNHRKRSNGMRDMCKNLFRYFLNIICLNY